MTLDLRRPVRASDSTYKLGNSSRHIAGLDGLRGFAVLAVLVFHATYWTSGWGRGDVFLSIAHVGWIGVDLFFVLSGFLITGVLLDSRGGHGYLRTFYSRRFLRIFPLYYGFLAVYVFLAAPLIFGPAGAGALRSYASWYILYGSNFLAASGRVGNAAFGIGHLWSLAVEEQFYLLWPLIVLLGGLRGTSRIAVGLLFLSLAFRASFLIFGVGAPVGAYNLLPSRMDELAAGGLLACGVRSLDPLTQLRRAVRVGIVSLPVALALLWSIDGSKVDLWAVPLAITTLALVFMGVVAGVLSYPRLASALDWRPLSITGRYSYAIYLFHEPIAFAMYWRGWKPHGLLSGLGFLAVCATASFLAAAFSWRYWEAPWLRLKERIPYAKTVGPPAAVPEAIGRLA